LTPPNPLFSTRLRSSGSPAAASRWPASPILAAQGQCQGRSAAGWKGQATQRLRPNKTGHGGFKH
jgi:hypothetical protein